MSERSRHSAVLALLICLLALGGSTSAATLPQGFSQEVLATGLDLPVDLAVAPDGRIFVALKGGTVRIIDSSGLRPTPFISLDDEINNAGDRGLLSIALDPAFATNGYVYLLYTVDPVYGEPEEKAEEAAFGRLTRYTATTESGMNVADPASRHIILGDVATRGFPSCYTTHTVGAVRFALDGTLYVSAGDGASKDYVDYGQNATSYSAGCEAMFGASQDTGALRSQDLNSLAGKVLRVDPKTGKGLPDNPFYTGNPDDTASKVWAYGLRQPFRFSVRPGSSGPGSIYLGDVGSSQYEELDIVKKGKNYGWPCYEGNSPNYVYLENPNTAPACQTVSSGSVTGAASAWSHASDWPAGFIGSSAVGGVFLPAGSFPSQYVGRYFFADYTESWIRTLIVTGDDQPGNIELFASGLDAPVALNIDSKTGDLLYISIDKGEVRAIRYMQTQHAPVAVAEASPTQGNSPLTVQFKGDKSYDVDGGTLTYAWKFGDGGTAASANTSHTYTVSGTYTASLTVTDPTGRGNTATVTIAVNNTAPQALIVSPEDGYELEIPGTVTLEADAVDAEEPVLPEKAFSWVIDVHHDEHIHYSWFVATGRSVKLAAETVEEGRVWFEVNLTVTDAGGLVSEDTIGVYPKAAIGDSDGDGLTDDQEEAMGTNPNRSDTDMDGLTDGEEHAGGKTDPLNPDTDGDGLSDGGELNTFHTDPIDSDSDNDGLTDGAEVYTHKSDPLKVDTDGDTLKDGDEVNIYKTDPTKVDTDGDGVWDAAELEHGADPTMADTDGDGVSDGAEILAGTAPDRADSDNDGLDDGDEATAGADPLDADTDHDGLTDGEEIEAGLDPLEADIDADGLNDGEEVAFGSDPLIADTDGDGLRDDEEAALGTDPREADTDGDGLTDVAEVDSHGTDPVREDTDSDGLQDGAEISLHHTDPLNNDTDGDGFLDGEEIDAGTDPLDPSSYPSGGCKSGTSRSSGGLMPSVGVLILLALRRRRVRQSP